MLVRVHSKQMLITQRWFRNTLISQPWLHNQVHICILFFLFEWLCITAMMVDKNCKKICFVMAQRRIQLMCKFILSTTQTNTSKSVGFLTTNHRTCELVMSIICHIDLTKLIYSQPTCSLRPAQPQLSLDSVKNPAITVAQKYPNVAPTVREFASTNWDGAIWQYYAVLRAHASEPEKAQGCVPHQRVHQSWRQAPEGGRARSVISWPQCGQMPLKGLVLWSLSPSIIESVVIWHISCLYFGPRNVQSE